MSREKVLAKLVNVINLIYPPLCINCKSRVIDLGNLCPDCWNKFDFISDQSCIICGKLFEIEVYNGNTCVSCIKDRPYYDKSISLFKYNEFSKDIIHKFKYEDNSNYAKFFSKWLFNRVSSYIENCDLIIPVPLHYLKLILRRYNQSALIAKEISILSNINYNPFIVKKAKYAKPQITLSNELRKTYIKNSFVVSEKKKQVIKNKSICLVDDVITTGSTINECAKLLKANGAKQVMVISLAKV